MTTWKRWPWYYRIGSLFVLALLLQGSSCPYVSNFLPRYQVPGVTGNVIAERYVGHYGPYYSVETTGSLNGSPHIDVNRYYPASLEYQLIDAYFRLHTELQVVGYDRSAIPGGAGSLPPLAMQ